MCMYTRCICLTAPQLPTAALAMGLFPSWFASENDWPSQLRLLDFPLADQAAGGYKVDADAALAALPAALRAFVEAAHAASAPLYVFTAGTAPPPYAPTLLAAGVEACRRVGARAVLLCSVGALVPSPLPDHACHATYAPFSALLQHAAAFCFNGGIGGVSQALRAGVPQVRTCTAAIENAASKKSSWHGLTAPAAAHMPWPLRPARQRGARGAPRRRRPAGRAALHASASRRSARDAAHLARRQSGVRRRVGALQQPGASTQFTSCQTVHCALTSAAAGSRSRRRAHRRRRC